MVENSVQPPFWAVLLWGKGVRRLVYCLLLGGSSRPPPFSFFGRGDLPNPDSRHREARQALNIACRLGTTSASRWATWCAGATPGKPSVLMPGTFGCVTRGWLRGKDLLPLYCSSDCLKPRRNGPAGSCGTGSGRRHAHPTERRHPVSGVRGTAPRTVLGSSPWCR